MLPETARRLSELMDSLISFGEVTPESRVLFVDDGSKDATWNIIESFEDPRFEGAKLAHNARHQLAVGRHDVGLRPVRCGISIDADLQDDPEAIRQLWTPTARAVMWSMACARAARTTRPSSV